MDELKQAEAVGSKSVPIGKRLSISLKAVGTGWGVFMTLVLGSAIIGSLKHSAMSPWPGVLMIGLGSAFVVLAVWLAVVLPLTFIPSRSAFWKPEMLTFVGASAAALLVCVGAIYELASNPTIRIYNIPAYVMGGVIFPGTPAVIIGGVAGFVMAKLHRRAQL